MTKKLTDSINGHVANHAVMYVKLHHYHWFIRGPHFFELHKKFEELYNETTLNMDEIAERLLSIGEKPYSTLKECLAAATIKEADGKEKNEKDMVSAIVKDFTQMAGELKETISLAEEEEDTPTADLLTGIKESLEKHTWMLNAFLG